MMDPYKVLGVSRSASQEEIKKSYRNLSRKYHPDANINNPNKKEAEDKFKESQQAYHRIMDEREMEDMQVALDTVMPVIVDIIQALEQVFQVHLIVKMKNTICT